MLRLVPQLEPLPQRRLKVRRKERIPALKELVAQITPKNRYEEIPSGPTRGKESIESKFPALRRDSPLSS
jgi:hypothetical protein